jgi:hypothetical protein
MLIQEVETDLSAAEVIERARSFFSLLLNPYAAFPSDEGESHIRFVTEAGELMIGVGTREGHNVVRGSTSRMHHELSQFLTTLSETEEVRQNTAGPGTSGAG